jgi:oxaloacetate decarboxylase alpha subunit/pyruvate carboxylase subunit B
MECAIKAARAAGAQAHGTICYTTSPVHNTDKFIEMGRKIEKMGAHAVVLKDMAGLIPPKDAYNIIKGLKQKLKIPVWIHTHDTAGLGISTYLAAIDAKVDAIDLSIAPFANGTSQPDTTRMLALLKGHPRCPEVTSTQIHTLKAIRQHLEDVYDELSPFTSHKNEIVDVDTLEYQVPGGMLSNFRAQLKEQKMEDKFEEVFREIPIVREALGWIPLVTPTSQIVGMQAFLNVKFGRWKQLSPQAADIALGYYGQCPASVDPKVQALAAKQFNKQPIHCRPVEAPDAKHAHMDDLKKELQKKGMPSDPEHCVIHAMFPQQLEAHLTGKGPSSTVTKSVETPSKDTESREKIGPRRYALRINGKPVDVAVEEVA